MIARNIQAMMKLAIYEHSNFGEGKDEDLLHNHTI